MSSSSERPAALGIIGFMVAAVLFAGLAGVLLTQLLEAKYSKEPVKAIVVVQRNVPAGEAFTEDALAVTEWPQSAIPTGAFSSVAAVLKEAGVPLLPMVKGEAVLASHLSRKGSGYGVAALLEGNKRAMAIKVDDTVALSGLVYPGARVDILSTVRGTGMATRIVLQNVKVLAVGEDIDQLTIARRRRMKEAKAAEEGGEGAFSAGDEDSREKRAVITVEVSPEEAEHLALASRDGNIDVALRNPKNKSTETTGGVTRLALMGAEEGGPMEASARMLLEMGGTLLGEGGVSPLNRGGAARKGADASASRPRRRKTTYTGKAKVEETPGSSVQIYRGGNK